MATEETDTTFPRGLYKMKNTKLTKFKNWIKKLLKRKPKIYLSGPMTNIPDLNYPAFDERDDYFWELGYKVFNPANNYKAGASWAWYVGVDLLMVLRCDKVAVLENWWESRGACIEVLVAVILNKTIIDAYSLKELTIRYDLRVADETGLLASNVPNMINGMTEIK